MSKSIKPSLKRPRTPEVPPITTADVTSETIEEEEQATSRPYNFSMSVDELSDMEKEVNDFCNEEDEDDEDEDDDDDNNNNNETLTRPAKQQRTSSFAPTTTTADNPNYEDDDNDDAYNSDSSSSQKLRDLLLGKKVEIDTDEEGLSDDDAPRGWRDNQKSRKKRS